MVSFESTRLVTTLSVYIKGLCREIHATVNCALTVSRQAMAVTTATLRSKLHGRCCAKHAVMPALLLLCLRLLPVCRLCCLCCLCCSLPGCTQSEGPCNRRVGR